MTTNDTYELGVRLLKACYGGDQAEMESLLRQGANPNFRIPDGEKNPLNPNWKGSQHLDFYLQYSRRAALEEVNAMRAWAIVEELRSYCQSLGANTDLECAELYCLFTGNEEEQDEKREKMSKFADGLSSAFLDDVNKAMESWFLLNLDHFRVRCPG